jgi:aspartate 1-decarboxylase
MLKAKLHGAYITESDPEYMGSITISREILDAAGMLPYEEVLCANFMSGERWITYIIPTDRPGVIGLNGPAALKGKVGDKLIVMSFCTMSEDEAQMHQPTVLLFNEDNSIKE